MTKLDPLTILPARIAATNMPSTPQTLPYGRDTSAWDWRRFFALRFYITLWVGCFVYTILIYTAVPRLSEVYRDFGMRLPAMTQSLIRLAELSRKIQVIVFLFSAATVLAFGLSMLTWHPSVTSMYRRRRWVGMALSLLLVLCLGGVLISMMLPMQSLIEGVSSGGRP